MQEHSLGMNIRIQQVEKRIESLDTNLLRLDEQMRQVDSKLYDIQIDLAKRSGFFKNRWIIGLIVGFMVSGCVALLY